MREAQHPAAWPMAWTSRARRGAWQRLTSACRERREEATAVIHPAKRKYILAAQGTFSKTYRELKWTGVRKEDIKLIAFLVRILPWIL